MSICYAMIVGTNGFKYNTSPTCDLSDTINKYRDDNRSISCIALGPSNYFAVVCDKEATFYGPRGFMSKMQELNISDIKHISFGCGNQWAVTLKNGICEAESFQNGCLKSVNEHNGNIKYVSLCDYENAWIVGYGQNEYCQGELLSQCLTGFLDGIQASNQEIKLVEIGDPQQYFIHYGTGYRWNVCAELSEWYEKSKAEMSTVSLYSSKNAQVSIAASINSKR
eukprot:UN04172